MENGIGRVLCILMYIYMYTVHCCNRLVDVMSLHFSYLTCLHIYIHICVQILNVVINKHIMDSGYVHVYSVCEWCLICVYLLLYLCVTTLVDLCSTNSIRISVEEDSDDGRWSHVLSHRLHHFNACLRLTISSVLCIYLFLICFYKKNIILIYM